MDEQNNFGYEPPVNPETNDMNNVIPSQANPMPDPAANPISYQTDMSASAPVEPAAEQVYTEQPAYGQADYTQNTYDQQAYQSAPSYNQGGDQAELEKRANTVKILGIVGIIVSVVIGCCCCVIPGPVIGIVGLVKANGLNPMLSMLSEQGQKNVKVGKICCIIAIALGALGLIFNIITTIMSGGTTAMMEEFMNEMY